jgi:hypothetical protein
MAQGTPARACHNLFCSVSHHSVIVKHTINDDSKTFSGG